MPRVAREFRHYDPDDREDYLLDDCTITRSSIRVLRELRETFTLEEEARYQELLTLIALNQHYVDEMRRGILKFRFRRRRAPAGFGRAARIGERLQVDRCTQNHAFQQGKQRRLDRKLRDA